MNDTELLDIILGKDKYKIIKKGKNSILEYKNFTFIFTSFIVSKKIVNFFLDDKLILKVK